MSVNHSRFLSGLPGFKGWAGGGHQLPGQPPHWDNQVECLEVNRASQAGGSSLAAFRAGGKKMTGKSRPLTPRQTNVSKSASVLITLEETPQGSLQFNPFRATTYGSTPFTTPPPPPGGFSGSDSIRNKTVSNAL